MLDSSLQPEADPPLADATLAQNDSGGLGPNKETLLDRVRQTVRRHGMIVPGDRVLVAVSGGPDSVALLLALRELAPDWKLKLRAIHVNHGLRGRGAFQDERFVQALCKRLRVPCAVRRLKIQFSHSPEELARDLRYEVLLKEARRFRCRRVAVGHTLDDQAETVLMRLLRGAGSLGLSAIPPVRSMADVVLIRPLIDAPREEARAYLRACKVTARQDPTNRNVKFLRNRIRREFLPWLEKRVHPQVRRLLAQSAGIFRAEHAFISAEAEKRMLRLCRRRGPDELTLPLEKLRSEPEALRCELLRLCYERLQGDKRRLSYRHLKDADRLLQSRSPRAMLDWPRGVRFHIHGGRCHFFMKRDGADSREKS